MNFSDFFGSGNVYTGAGSDVALNINSSSEQWIAIKVSNGLATAFPQESGGGYVSSFNSVEDLIAGIVLKGKAVAEATTSDLRNFSITGAVSNPQTDTSFRSGSTLSRWNYTVNFYTPYTGLSSPLASQL